MHSVCSLITQKSLSQLPTDTHSHKLLISVCAGLALFALNLPASAGSKFTFTSGELQFDWQFIPSIPDVDEISYFITDLNGDGATDIVILGATDPSNNTGTQGPQSGLILFNNGDNTFTPAEGDVPGSEAARELLLEDFNGDGILDMYIADHGYDAPPFPGFKNQLLLGTGNGFTDVSNRLPNIEAFTHNGAVGDIDGDGDIDILSLNAPDNPPEEISYFLINDGSANFTQNRERLPDSLGSADPSILRTSFSAELADLDGDGFPELIVGRRESNPAATRIFWNDGAGFFSDTAVSFLEDADIFGGLENISIIEIKGTDVNGDGLIDLLLHATNQFTYAGISMQLFINQGNREFKDQTVRRFTSLARDPDVNRRVSPFTQFLDINGDGITDILPWQSLDTSDDGIVVFEGTGDGCFSPITWKSISDDPEVRFRISHAAPLISSSGVGYVNAGVFSADSIVLEYFPIDIQPAAPIANLYNSCREKIEVTVDVDGSFYALDFSIFSAGPEIVIQAIASSVRELTEGLQNVAIFDSGDGKLTIPELVLDGEVAYRNLVFQLTDGEQLLFRLDSAE